MKPTLNPIMNILMLLISLGMVLYFSFQIYAYIQLKYFSNETKGTITGYFTKEDVARFKWNRNPVYAPTFTFKDGNGNTTNIITTTYQDDMPYKKGDSVTVYYNPEAPEKAQLPTSFPWSRNILLLCMGLAGFYITIRPFWKFIKQ